MQKYNYVRRICHQPRAYIPTQWLPGRAASQGLYMGAARGQELGCDVPGSKSGGWEATCIFYKSASNEMKQQY